MHRIYRVIHEGRSIVYEVSISDIVGKKIVQTYVYTNTLTCGHVSTALSFRAFYAPNVQGDSRGKVNSLGGVNIGYCEKK